MMHQRGGFRGKIGIEALLRWAFQTELATVWEDNGLDLTARTPLDSCLKIERLDLLGPIDTTAPGARVAARDTAHDAEIVAEAVMALAPALGLMVYRYAKAGARPPDRAKARHRFLPLWADDGVAGEPTPLVQVVPEWLREGVDATGKPRWRQRWEWDSSRGRRSRVPLPTWCPVREVDMPGSVAADRARYSEWREALAELRWCLVGRLERWSLTGELPPQRPWEAANAG